MPLTTSRSADGVGADWDGVGPTVGEVVGNGEDRDDAPVGYPVLVPERTRSLVVGIAERKGHEVGAVLALNPRELASDLVRRTNGSAAGAARLVATTAGSG